MTDNFRLATVAAAVLLGTLPLGAAAQTQTYAVDCTRGQTISKALEQGDARKPMLIIVRGTCAENVAITRDDVTIRGQAGSGAGVSAASGSEATLTVRATRIAIDALTVSGGLNGIVLSGTHDVSLTNSLIRGAAQNGLSLESSNLLAQNNTITGHGGAGVFLRFSRARLVDNQIHSNGGAGINAQQLSAATMQNNSITGNGAQGLLLYNGSLGAVAGGTIASNASNGIELTVDSRAVVTGATIAGNDNGIHVSYSHVTISAGSISGQRRSGLFLTAGRAELTGVAITGNGNQGIGGTTGSTLRVTGGTVSGNGANGVSMGHHGTVFVSGTTIQSNGGAGILLSLGTKLLLGAPTDATGNAGWSLDCLDAESSFTGPLIGSIAPGCTGY